MNAGDMLVIELDDSENRVVLQYLADGHVALTVHADGERGHVTLSPAEQLLARRFLSAAGMKVVR